MAQGKRTILTAGEKVHRINFRLGQSTILYLGFKPETVICGNKNYFNIEKIREGVTIQPLANFATNLSVLDKERRYLFYLVPAGANGADSFVDVRWVPESEMLPIERLASSKLTRVREIGQIVAVGRELGLRLLRVKAVQGSPRRILEIELRNAGRTTLKTANVAVLAMAGRKALSGQVIVWEKDMAKAGERIGGRLIVTQAAPTLLDLVVRFQGKDTVTRIPGGLN